MMEAYLVGALLLSVFANAVLAFSAIHLRRELYEARKVAEKRAKQNATLKMEAE